MSTSSSTTASSSSLSMTSSSSSSLIPLNRRDTVQLIDTLLLSYSKDNASSSSSSTAADNNNNNDDNNNDRVSNFITKGTEYLSLETIRSILIEKLTLIKQDLVQVINKDYTAFIALSSSLEKSDHTILHLRDPLALVSQHLTELYALIQNYNVQVHHQQNIALIYSCITQCTEFIMFIQEKLTLAEQYFSEAIRINIDNVMIPLSNTNSSSSNPPTATSSSSSSGVSSSSRLMNDIQNVYQGFAHLTNGSSFISSTLPDTLVSSSSSSSSSFSSLVVHRSQLFYRGILLFTSSEQYLVHIIDIIQLLFRKFDAAVPLSSSSSSSSSTTGSSNNTTTVNPSLFFRSILPYDTLRSIQIFIQRIIPSFILPLIETTTETSLRSFLSTVNAFSSNNNVDILSTTTTNLSTLLTNYPSLRAFYYCSLSVSLISTSSVSIFLQYYYKAIITTYTLPYYDQTILLPSNIEDNSRGSFRGLGKSFTVLLNDIQERKGIFNTLLYITRNMTFIDILSNCCWVPLVAKLTSTSPIQWARKTSESVVPSDSTSSTGGGLLLSSTLPLPTVTLSPWPLASSFFSTIPHIFHNNYTQLSAFFLQLCTISKDICIYSPPPPSPPPKHSSSHTVATTPSTTTNNYDICILYDILQRIQSLNSSPALSPSTIMVASQILLPTASMMVDTVLLSHPSTVLLTNAWKTKLPIYAQLRNVEISQRIEQCLSQQNWSTSNSTNNTKISTITVPLQDIFQSLDSTKQSVFAALFSSSSPLLKQLSSSLSPSTTSSSVSTMMINELQTILTAPSSPSFVLTLPPTILIWSTLRSLWSPATFLPPLLSSTILHGIEIINRYIVWICKGLVLYSLKLNVPDIAKFISNLQHVTNNIPVDTNGTTDTGATLPYPLQDYDFVTLPENLTRSILTAEAQAVLDTLNKSNINSSNPSTPYTPTATPISPSLLLPNLPTPSSLIMVTPVSHPDYFLWLEILQGNNSNSISNTNTTTNIASSTKSIILPYSAIESLLFTLSDIFALSSASSLLLMNYGMNYSGLLSLSSTNNNTTTKDNTDKQYTIVSSILPTVATMNLLIPEIMYLVRYSLRQYNSSVCASIRAIPATFRMSNTSTASRTLPRSASVYIASALRPIKTILQTIHNHYSLPNLASSSSSSSSMKTFYSYVSELVLQSTVDLFTDIYTTLSQVFDNINTMEASLQWLKSSSSASLMTGTTGTGTPSSSLSSITDTDKIGLQLYYDILGIGNELTGSSSSSSSTVGTGNELDIFLQFVYRMDWDPTNTYQLKEKNDNMDSSLSIVVEEDGGREKDALLPPQRRYREQIIHIYNQQMYPLVQNYRSIANAVNSSTSGK